MSSGLIRVRKYKPGEFFQALKAPFQDNELSFGARGILAYLLTHGDGWEVQNKDLYKQSPAGKYAVDKMMNELKEAGYMRRTRVSQGKGIIKWVTEVYENRLDNPDHEAPEGEGSNYTKPDFSNDEKPDFENLSKPDFSKVESFESRKTDTYSNNETTRNNELEDKDDEEKGADENFSQACKFYENEIGLLSPIISDKLKDLVDTYPLEWIGWAIEKAVEHNARKMSYIKACLENRKAGNNGHRQRTTSKGQRETNGKAGRGKQWQKPAATVEELVKRRAAEVGSVAGQF